MIPTVNVRSGWETVMEGAAREKLEREVLPGYLRSQRWFGGKGRRIEAVRFVDWGGFPARDEPVFTLLLEVGFADGHCDLYFLPVGVSSGESAARCERSHRSWAIARLLGPKGEGLLHDALADDDTCLSLLNVIGSNGEFTTRQGRIVALATKAFSSLVGDSTQKLSVERGPAKSSNTLIFYGKRLLLKLFRRLESGINPDYEIGRFLTEGHLFERIPRVAGTLEYRRSGSEPITLALLQSFVASQGDGWQHALDELRHYYQRASNRPDADGEVDSDHRSLLQLTDREPPADAVEILGGYLEAACTLGRRTAEMHHALSLAPHNPDFAPEPFTPRDAEALRGRIRQRGEEALTALADNLHHLPQDVATSARQLLEEGPNVLRSMTQGPLPYADAVRIRCHGDYHLGQVLRVQNDYVILDFEGEPMRTVDERRAKQSPLKDVAGMLRSYHFAAYAGLFAFTHERPEEFDRLQPWAELWFQWVSAAFLRAYRASAYGEEFVPEDPAAFADLLDAFMLEKMFYELHYELNNRPDWVRIPLRSVLAQLMPSEPQRQP